MDSVMSGTINILSDNRTADPDRFGCEHGLSVLVRTPSANILMDTGASGLFAVNAARMGIDLSDVDYVFLSHEMALYVDGLLYPGCAHNGLENILDACPWPVDTVIGGFHLLDSNGMHFFESEEELTALAERLVACYPQVSFLTGHCTGNGAFRILQSVMGSKLRQFACGMQIDMK